MENHITFLRNKFESATNKELTRSLYLEFIGKETTRDIALQEARIRGVEIDRINILDIYNNLCNEQIEFLVKFEKVSIRGRVAYGICCIEKLAYLYKLKNQKFDELLELLWLYISSSRLDLWEATILDLMPDENCYWLFSQKFGFEHIPYNEQFILTVAIINVVDIARGNLYAGYRSFDTMMYFLRLIDNMNNNNIDLPDPSPFLKSKVDEDHGWGNIVKPGFFKEV